MSARQRKSAQRANNRVKAQRKAKEENIGTAKHVLSAPLRWMEKVPLVVRITVVLTMVSLVLPYYVPENQFFNQVLKYSTLK